MKNPLRDLSRPKALGLAGVAAGALTVSAAAAALNVGLLSAHQKPAFAPTPVAETSGVVQDTTTTQAPVEVVYQDVYDHVSAPAGSSAPASSAPAAPVAAAPASSPAPSSDDDTIDPSDEGTDDGGEIESDDQESEDHESEDHETEDHETEDHSTEDGGGFDD